MNRYTQMSDDQLKALAYHMLEGAQVAASAAAELRRRARRDSAIDRTGGLMPAPMEGTAQMSIHIDGRPLGTQED